MDDLDDLDNLLTRPPASAPQDSPELIDVREVTSARIQLGRTGSSLRTRDQLAFQLDHAAARDAVHMELDTATLAEGLRARQWPVYLLRSQIPADSQQAGRRTYLRRPDLGRRLAPASAAQLSDPSPVGEAHPEIVFVLAEGLSALALERNALPFLDALDSMGLREQWRVGPVCLVRDGRVAVADEVGALLHATLTVMLIGERPGLSAPDSMGVYITWSPQVGRTDAERNCISNVRQGGLSYGPAATQLLAVLERAGQLGRTGVLLSGADVAAALP